MRLVLIGCQYAGKTTLARGIARWLASTTGTGVRVHDHWTVPNVWDQDPATCYVIGPDDRVLREKGRYGELGGSRRDELAGSHAAEVADLSPWLLEQLQRAMVWRHLHPTAYQETGELGEVLHGIQVDFYYAEAVYAPLYYGYGGPGTFADRDRRAREWDEELMALDPETVLVYLKATPDEIRRRLTDAPHAGSMLRSEDVEQVLQRYEEQYGRSLFRRKIAIETTASTPEQALAAFGSQVAEHLTPIGRQRVDEGRSAGRVST